MVFRSPVRAGNPPPQTSSLPSPPPPRAYSAAKPPLPNFCIKKKKRTVNSKYADRKKLEFSQKPPVKGIVIGSDRSRQNSVAESEKAGDGGDQSKMKQSFTVLADADKGNGGDQSKMKQASTVLAGADTGGGDQSKMKKASTVFAGADKGDGGDQSKMKQASTVFAGADEGDGGDQSKMKQASTVFAGVDEGDGGDQSTMRQASTVLAGANEGDGGDQSTMRQASTVLADADKPPKKRKAFHVRIPKLFIRIGSNINRVPAQPQNVENQKAKESPQKKWNFRPRNSLAQAKNMNNGGAKAALSGPVSTPNGNAIANRPVGAKKEKEKKHNYSVALSRQDIEEDIFAMTGSRPSRRPQKRAKKVQKQVDYVSPGMWLTSITVDAYKAYAPYVKRANSNYHAKGKMI